MTAKITARKWMGDDTASWAVFIPGQAEPFVSGLTRSEVPYYKRQAEQSVYHRSHTGREARMDCTICRDRGLLES